MKLLRGMSMMPFLLGAAFLVAGVACGGGEKKQEDDLQQFDNRTPTETVTDTATASATSTVTPVNTPTATPTPYDGAVARMSIPSIKVDYPIEVLGLTNGNELATPKNVTGAIGWYHIPEFPNLKKPGFGGDAMFSAHVNYEGSSGPFVNLSKVQGGDKIIVTMDNGTAYTYEVFAVHGYVIDPQYQTATRPVIDMGELIDTPTKPSNEEWITLITCSCDPGRVIIPPGQRYGECVDRDVVLARRVL